MSILSEWARNRARKWWARTRPKVKRDLVKLGLTDKQADAVLVYLDQLVERLVAAI